MTRTALATLWDRVIARRSTPWPIAGDSLRALLVALISLAALEAQHHRLHSPLSGLALILTLAATLPLVGRRRWPLAVLAIVAGAQALYLATSPLGETLTGLGLAVALYTAASCTERRFSLRLATAVVALNGLVLLAAIALGRPGSGPSLVLMTVLAVGSWSLGDNVRTRRAYLAGLEERARRLEREREENARRAAEDERSRIARELHDVVAHHVSAIAVQAGAATEIVMRDPQRAGEALRFIQETSRQALMEMRALLNVLRSEDGGAERGPQPRMAEVARLIGQSRAAGLPVTLRVEGAARPLPEALDLSAYRIVQEALTNSLAHAGPVPTAVRVCYAPDALELEIRDEGVGPSQTLMGTGGGRGLVGMRERVALFGGELSAGPAPGQDRGFRVWARLPLRGQGP